MEGEVMRIILLCLVISISTSANYIIKYQDGSSEAVAKDPRRLINVASSAKAISYIEKDVLLHAHESVEYDPLLSEQWVYGTYLDSSFSKAKNFQGKRDEVIVAVVDTGILYHEDLNERLLPGADLITDLSNSRDGDGRDFDPVDEGDYGQGNCRSVGTTSSWHGTHVTGIIAAVSGNFIGVTGMNDDVKILPLRVLGPCGGRTSDIADAIRYAAGGTVSGLGTNTDRAKINNLSLGGLGSCSQYMQEAIDFANDQGSVVIVSAGNDGASIDTGAYTPSNCRGVFRIGSSHPNLRQSTFSNYGSSIDIYAPGDNIYSLSNLGSTKAGIDSYISLSGTSMSAGFVSAVAAGVMGINSEITSEQVKGLLTEGAKKISCLYGGCSSGTINPYAIYISAQYIIRDDSYEYDEGDIVNDLSPIASSVEATGTDGGSCGTLILDTELKSDEKDNSSFYRTIIVMIFVFFLLNSYFRKYNDLC